MSIGLVLLAWLDQWLDAQPAPEAWRRAIGPAETLPPGLAIFVIGAFVMLFAAWELSELLRVAGVRASLGMTTLASLAGMSAPVIGVMLTETVSQTAALASLASATLLLAIFHYSSGRNLDGVIAATGGAALAFVYLGLLFGFFIALRLEHSAWVVLGVIAVAKSADIGGYAAGKTIGRRKLIPWLSPGKTWEGLIGAVALAAIVGALAAWGFWSTPLAEGVDATPTLRRAAILGAGMGAALALAGQAGDLIASAIKRDAGAKDASALLPGFGGVLDVLDSLLLAVPVAYWMLHPLTLTNS